MATRLDIATLYSATFNRAADADGLDYWISDGTDATTALTSLEDLASAMTASAEYTALYDGLDREATINAMYSNLFNRVADTDGLAYWSTGEGSSVAIDQMIIALINGAQDTVEFGNDATVMANKGTVGLAFADAGLNDVTLATSVMSGVTDDDATVTAAEATVADAEAAASIDGETFELTTGTDSFVGTAANDLFTAANGTLATADTILDSSSTDADIMNVETTTTSAAPRLQNIETINLTGKYTSVGLDLASTSGTEALNVNTNIANGTATILNAASLNATAINAGANIDTLSVTATASGTRDSVSIDAGSASSVTIKGNAGTDTFDATVADGASVTLNVNGGTADIDAFTLNTMGGTLTLDGDATAKTVSINNTSDALTATLTTGQTVVGTGATSTFDITGDADVTLVSADTTDLDGIALVNSGAGTTTLKITDTAIVGGEADLNEFVADVVNLAGAATGAQVVTVNEGTYVNLTKDVTGAASDVTLDVDNTDGDMAANTGTLLLNVSENIDTGGAIVTGSNVKTVLLEATPDEVTDTDSNENGTVDTQITIAELDMAANGADTLVVQGSEDLKITLLTNSTSDVVAATGMTGKLTIGDTAAAATITLGSGNDTVLDTKDAAVATIYGNGGDDKITTGTGDDKIYGGTGDDTLNGGAGADTIKGEAGDDKIDGGAGADTITVGAGSDTVTMVSGQDGDTITDLVAGTDTLVLTGAGQDIDLTDLTVTSAAYDLDGTGAFDITLTGSTATDLADSVQLGSTTAEYEVAATVTGSATTTVVAGDKDDVIKVTEQFSGNGDADVVNLTLGAGADTLVLNEVDDGTDAAVVTVTDFTTSEDKVVFEGTAAGNVDLSSAVTPASGVYDIDGAGTFAVTLKDATVALTDTDVSSMFQLGSENASFDASGNDITGGTFDDYITNTGAASVISFIDNGGMDTVASFATGTDDLSFDGITGITATSGTTATTTKTTDAQDGAVYVFGDVTSTAYAGEKVSTFTVDTDGNTADTILTDVAALLEASLGEADGENYIAVMNDGTSSYAYLVAGDADGIDAANVTLIGTIDTAIVAVGDIA